MEAKQCFFLRNARIQQNAIGVIHSLALDDKNPVVVEIKPLTEDVGAECKTSRNAWRYCETMQVSGEKT